MVTAYGSDEWLNALRKSVHPAGFAVFGKIQISSRLNVKPGTIGASLGGGVAHPTAASVITSIVDVFDSVQIMSHQVVDYAAGDLTVNITLEESPDNYAEDAMSGVLRYPSVMMGHDLKLFNEKDLRRMAVSFGKTFAK